MEDADQDSKSTSLSHLREALLSSSTKRRGAGLATLHQLIVQSGKSGERIVIEVADHLQLCHRTPVPRPSTSSS